METLNEQYLYRRNIKVNYYYFFLMSLSITRGFWMIYLASKGMSLVQLGILEGMFHVTSFVMETPTGAIADLFGRKISRILSRFFLVGDALLILYGTSFTHFLLAFVLCAIGWNLESGAGDALVYDSLVEIKEESSYMKVNGRIETTYQIAQAAGLAIGGLIAGISYSYLYYGQVVIIAASVAVALLFTETKVGRDKEQEQENGKPGLMECLKRQYVDSFKIVKGNNRLIYMIIFLNALGVFTTTTFFYMQIYCKENGMKENAIGIVFAISCILGAIGGLSAHRIEGIVKERKLLLASPVIFMILLWGMVWFKTALVTFTVIGMFDSLMYVVYFDYVNRLIPSAERATLLSFTSMVFSFFMVLIFPVFGKIGDLWGLNYAFGFVACVATVLVLINLCILIPKKGNADA